jgi:hypothetical protein
LGKDSFQFKASLYLTERIEIEIVPPKLFVDMSEKIGASGKREKETEDLSC